MRQNSKNFDHPKFVMLDGKIVPFAEAKISVMAPGLTFAVTVFEGLRAYWNNNKKQLYIFRIKDHLDRLEFSMRLVELSPSPTSRKMKRQIVEVLRANGLQEDSYIRTQAYVDEWGDMMSHDPVGTSIISWRRPRAKAFQEGKHFSVSSWRRNAEDASPPRLKSAANYLNGRLAGLEALRAGSEGAIILNTDGTVSEGPGGCIFIVRNGSLITPSLSSGILESITRDTILTIASDLKINTVERSIGRTELYLASEVFYCGTAQEIVPILSIDKMLISKGEPGQITRQIQKTYDSLVRGNNPKYNHWLTKVFD